MRHAAAIAFAHDSLTVGWECPTEAEGAEEVFSFQVRCFEEQEDGEWTPLNQPKGKPMFAPKKSPDSSDASDSADDSTTVDTSTVATTEPSVAGTATAAAEDAPAAPAAQEEEEKAQAAQEDEAPALSEEAEALKSRAMQHGAASETSPEMHEISADAREWSCTGLKAAHGYMVQICSLTARGSSGWGQPACFMTEASVKVAVSAVSAVSASVEATAVSAESANRC